MRRDTAETKGTVARTSPAQVIDRAWWAVVVLAAVLLLTPGIVTTGRQPLGVDAGYPAEVLHNSFRMVRVAMPCLPAGLLLALALPVTTVRLLALLGLAAGAVVVMVGAPEGARVSLLRDLIFATSGLAAGLWLAERSFRGGPSPESRAEANVWTAATRSVVGVGHVPSPPGAATSEANSNTADKSHSLRLARRAIGGLLIAAALVLALGLPRWGPFVAGALALCALLIAWRPLSALVVVPAAMPLLDLAPWTGRIFLDEFDLLLVATTGAVLLHAPPAPAIRSARFSSALIVLFLLTSLLSAALGLLPVGPLDANAFSSYWSPYNALRVGKGLLWGVLLFWMVRRAGADETRLGRLLALGMGIGLLGVGLVGVWERWLFAGLGDEASTYRIVATFSSMHTGGGHIEASLVAALPFLWLGMFRLRSAVLALPVLALSAYVLLYTVARGGVLAFVAMASVLAVGTLRGAWHPAGPGLRRVALPVAALAAATAVVLAGASGGYLAQRFEQSAQDWNTRMQHWQLALGIADDSWAARFFGTGLGSFPRIYLWRAPADQQAAGYAFVDEPDGHLLRLGLGDELYIAQRVDVQGGAAYRLQMELRSRAPDAALSTPLCEKQLLNARRCDWLGVTVPGDGAWHTVTREIAPATVGAGPPWRHLPVELYFHNVGKAGVIDIRRVSLRDAAGRELLDNGDFARGSDFWFMKTKSHLPWHIKNLWVHTFFEMGGVGLAILVALSVVAVVRLARAGWQGSQPAWALLASLSGLLTVGVFDSLLDTPRLAMFLVAWLFLGATLGWMRPERAGSVAATSESFTKKFRE
jgi:O-Antigen ligase